MILPHFYFPFFLFCQIGSVSDNNADFVEMTMLAYTSHPPLPKKEIH